MPQRTPVRKLNDPAAQARVDALADVDTTQPLEHRTDPAGALVKAQPNGDGQGGTTDPAPAFRDLIEIVQHAETQRFEGQVAIECYSLLDAARRQQADRKLVDPEVIRKLRTQVEGWAIQRGLAGNGDGGS